MIMDSPELEIEYKGQHYNLPVSVHPYGYSYRIHVLYQGMDLVFEPDEEQQFRAIKLPEHDEALQPDMTFLSLLASALHEALH